MREITRTTILYPHYTAAGLQKYNYYAHERKHIIMVKGLYVQDIYAWNQPNHHPSPHYTAAGL